MNIDELSDQEKSVLLAKAAGQYIKTEDTGIDLRVELYHANGDIAAHTYVNRAWAEDYKWSVLAPNLYDPDNMAKAWRVLHWAIGDLSFSIGYDLLNLAPDVAQRTWLDEVLTLAIEAGVAGIDAGD